MTHKNSSKKLVLDRETLVPLQPEQLENVQGGISVAISKSCCQRNSCNGKSPEM